MAAISLYLVYTSTGHVMLCYREKELQINAKALILGKSPYLVEISLDQK